MRYAGTRARTFLLFGLVCALAGCGSSHAGVHSAPATVSPSPTAAPREGQAAVPNDAAAIRARGYAPSPRYVSVPAAGGTLYAWHATCAGSGDGYCQAMFFFLGTRYLGMDTRNPSAAILNWQAAGTGTVAVTYARYGKNDPLCCPTGRPVTLTYRWTGTVLEHSGRAPGQSG